MRILYDGSVYSWQKAGGINRYFSNLINHLPQTVRPTLAVEEVRPLNFPTHTNLSVYLARRFDFRPRRISHRLQRYYNMIVTGANRYDVAHPTYYTCVAQANPAQSRCPVVITVYDMIHELFADRLDPTGQRAQEKRAAILAAQAVLCISENTKQDLLKYYPVPEERVHVTYLATEMDTAQSYGAEPVPERPYFLYVGSRASYKNFDGLLAAFAGLGGSRRDASLCVVGSPFTPSEEEAIADLGLTGRVENYGQVGDEHLAKLYRCSLAFVYPSLYEGFGIPPLEAMVCGTVVVAANRSCIPEVVGDAGLLFDPDAPGELADILQCLYDGHPQRAQLIERGRVRAAQFSWEKTTAQTVDVYQSVRRH